MMTTNPRDYNLAQGLMDLMKAKYPGVDFLVMPNNDGSIELVRLQVPVAYRKTGIGSAVMSDLASWADANQTLVWLQVAKKDPKWGTTSRSRLVKFYRRFGFVENKGKKIRYELSMYASMYRVPRRITANPRKARLPKTAVLYHVTDMFSGFVIRKEGIKPQKGYASRGALGQDIRQVKNAIFAFTHPEDAVRWASDLAFSGAKAVIIVFSTDLDLWFPDPHFQASMATGQWLASHTSVKPEQILTVVPFDMTKVRAKGFKISYLDDPIKTWLKEAGK